MPSIVLILVWNIHKPIFLWFYRCVNNFHTLKVDLLKKTIGLLYLYLYTAVCMIYNLSDCTFIIDYSACKRLLQVKTIVFVISLVSCMLFFVCFIQITCTHLQAQPLHTVCLCALQKSPNISLLKYMLLTLCEAEYHSHDKSKPIHQPGM